MTLLDAHAAVPTRTSALPLEVTRRSAEGRAANRDVSCPANCDVSRDGGGVAIAHATPIQLRASVRWPCLARAIRPELAPTAELLVDARIVLSGAPHALSGRLEIAALPDNAEHHPGEGVHLLADLALHGALTSSGGWVHLAVAGGEPTRGTLSLDLTISEEGWQAIEIVGPGRFDARGDSDAGTLPLLASASRVAWPAAERPAGDGRPWHVRTNLFRWLAIPGGRYGRPTAQCRLGLLEIPKPDGASGG